VLSPLFQVLGSQVVTRGLGTLRLCREGRRFSAIKAVVRAQIIPRSFAQFFEAACPYVERELARCGSQGDKRNEVTPGRFLENLALLGLFLCGYWSGQYSLKPYSNILCPCMYRRTAARLEFMLAFFHRNHDAPAFLGHHTLRTSNLRYIVNFCR
jgi:hypothetical protein